jgi:hypothetical protein
MGADGLADENSSGVATGVEGDSRNAFPGLWGEEQMAVRVEDLPALLDLGRGACYAGVNEYLASGGAAGIPARRVGRRIIVPLPELLRWLGAEVTITKSVERP